MCGWWFVQVYENENKLLAQVSIYRQFIQDGVKRLDIKDGKIRGTLFLPPGSGQTCFTDQLSNE